MGPATRQTASLNGRNVRTRCRISCPTCGVAARLGMYDAADWLWHHALAGSNP